MTTALESLDLPDGVRRLSPAELRTLAGEVRRSIIETVSRTGGHLAANLGVVELTVALLKMFDPGRDRIVWDVSHQGYAYKILTGRLDRMSTLRQVDGLSGFLKRDESPYDVFGAGHSGTALSAALGMAAARDRRGTDEHVVAILGDGAVGNGIAFEALNNLATTTSRLIVILNDNEMSISANVGALAVYLGKLLANPRYNRWKRSVESVARRMHMGWLRSVYYRLEEAVKSLFLESVIFEEFGLRYIGPINGHNIEALVDALAIARESQQPVLLHVSTVKGKGYRYAEQLPEKWHGTPGFDVESGELSVSGARPGYSAVFGRVLEQMAERDERIVAITAAMPAGTGLSGFAQRFPKRFFDVGISEEHAAVFAAGLAAEGLRPVFAVYSTFAQRAVDCIIHDICLQKLPVTICLDRAGIVGDDGPTHHGVFDIALLRCIPNLVIMQPRDEAQLAHMLATAMAVEGASVIRYPRGAGPGAAVPQTPRALPVGQAEEIKPGTGAVIWALGDMQALGEQTVNWLQDRGVDAGLVDPRFVRPLDRDRLRAHLAGGLTVATLENGVLAGGFGSAVREAAAEDGCASQVLAFGWPDTFIPHGAPAVLMERYGLTPEAVGERIAAAAAAAVAAAPPDGKG